MKQITPSETLAGRLRAAITARGISAAALARSCGLSKQNLQRLLSGTVLRSKHLPSLASALEVSMSWLAMGDPSTSPGWWHGVAPTRSDHGPSQIARPSSSAKNIRSTGSFWRPHWQIVIMKGKGGLPIADDGDGLIIDPQGKPYAGSILLFQDKRGMRLKRHGGMLGHHVMLASVDRAIEQEAVRASYIGEGMIVVGIVFAMNASR